MTNIDCTVVKVTRERLPDPLVTGPQVCNDWIRRREDWEDYAIVQEVDTKPHQVQCALFRMALGTDGKKLLRNQPIPKKPSGESMDATKVPTLMEMLRRAVMGEVNETYELYVCFRHVPKKKANTLTTS